MASPAPYEIKRHDVEPPLVVTLLSLGQPLDLTGAVAVNFVMRVRGGATAKVNAATTILQTGPGDTANRGKVSYAWSSGDTDTSGVYDAEFSINWGGGRTQTVPNDDYLVVIVQGDLA